MVSGSIDDGLVVRFLFHCVGLDDCRGGACMQTLVTVRLDVFRHGMEHHGMFHLCQPVNVDIR